MTALAALQDSFQDLLLGRSDRAPGLAKEGPHSGAATRLQVYVDAYAARLLEVLGKDFPTLAASMGEEAFDDMARAYLKAHPSRHPSVRWLGKGLPRFLAFAAPWSAQPGLAEMAALEWALGEAFDAADASPVPVADLASVPGDAWPGLGFRFHPSLRRLEFAWKVADWKQAFEDGEIPADPPEPANERMAWLIWRHPSGVRHRGLEPAEAAALDTAGRGETFAEVCQALVDHVPEDEAPGHAAGLLAGWLQDGLVVGISRKQ